jgi:hypothetical protein
MAKSKEIERKKELKKANFWSADEKKNLMKGIEICGRNYEDI